MSIFFIYLAEQTNNVHAYDVVLFYSFSPFYYLDHYYL